MTRLHFDLTWDKPANAFLDLLPPTAGQSQALGDASSAVARHLEHDVASPEGGRWAVRVCGDGPEALVGYSLLITAT
jgi:hypothetical protein